MALNYIGKLEDYQRIRTEQPIREIWAEWLKLSDHHYLRPRWKDHSETDYRRVSALIKQAHEYHLAGSNTSLLTRPELIYYSFLYLTKAALMLTTDDRPPDHHGLCKPTMADSLLEIGARTNRGVFLELVKAFGGHLPVGARVSLKICVENCIELRRSYLDYFLGSSPIIVPEVDVFTNGVIRVEVRPENCPKAWQADMASTLKSNSSLYEDFKELQRSPTIVLEAQVSGASLETKGIELMAKHFSFSVFEDFAYYLNLAPKGERLSHASAYFAIVFLLGALVRYSATHLEQFITSNATSVGWFLRELCDTSERVYPNLLLNRIRRRSLKFSPSFGWW